jgi:hypothetical protein
MAGAAECADDRKVAALVCEEAHALRSGAGRVRGRGQHDVLV